MNAMKNYESVVDALADLKQRGYIAEFESTSYCLYCGDLDVRLDTDDFHIDEFYRFEDGCSPEEASTLYAITSNTGVKGTLLNTAGNGGACKLSDAREIHEQYAFVQRD
jgi:hypothetical protein